jgi:hypothetical protein
MIFGVCGEGGGMQKCGGGGAGRKGGGEMVNCSCFHCCVKSQCSEQTLNKIIELN